VGGDGQELEAMAERMRALRRERKGVAVVNEALWRCGGRKWV